jgi:hypothetical protein
VEMADRGLALAGAGTAPPADDRRACRHRQLRLVHLQPRPAPGELYRADRPPQRRGERRRGDGERPGRHPDLPRPRRPGRRRHLVRGHPPRRRPAAPPRGLPWPPVPGRRLWRPRRPRRADHARQDLAHPARRARPPTAAEPVHRHPLSSL